MTTYRFRQRGRTSADWDASNEILLENEIGVEEDTKRFKIGDGVTPWMQLEGYFLQEAAIQGLIFDAVDNVSAGPIAEEIALQLLDHVNNPTPHPAYDDIPSFALKWTNVIT